MVRTAPSGKARAKTGGINARTSAARPAENPGWGEGNGMPANKGAALAARKPGVGHSSANYGSEEGIARKNSLVSKAWRRVYEKGSG